MKNVETLYIIKKNRRKPSTITAHDAKRRVEGMFKKLLLFSGGSGAPVDYSFASDLLTFINGYETRFVMTADAEEAHNLYWDKVKKDFEARKRNTASCPA